ncbi:MAG TPA: peptidase U32 family protein [Rectinema sp.]|nr:peptidase U32 family protein [Rectinema sp.]HNY98699.1 peptidase U32 family protein [Rectinema sp.]HOE75000.1 peptidase U32 family protein [Rectinema sp.]HOM92128.1 peptidase U32 family protein [Rectinema sp.]HOR47837.1 peptidase U32 family protein [Rectinema sp.]
MKKVELLAPAGSREALDAAIGEGADAVYLGLRSFNARMRTTNFAFNQFEAAVYACHYRSRRIYVTVNTVFEERESDRIYQLLEYLATVGPDGIIVQDAGVAKIAHDYFPSLPLHASTQMNIASAAGCNQLSRAGFKRAVLARELSLEEIRQIRQYTSLELEVFVHGALCVSASGLCLFSSYLGGKSANRGQCTQACRRLYESEKGKGYYFSPDDLELIEYLPDLITAGADAFKIEGRMKSAEYVGTVVSAYRFMLDNYEKDRERAILKAKAILQSDFARRKTNFFISGKSEDYIHPEQSGGTGIALGKIRDARTIDGKRWALLNSYEGLAERDSVRIHRKDDSGRITAKIQAIRYEVYGMLLLLDGDWRQNDELYLIQTASMTRNYKPVLPKNLDKFHKFPSNHAAPRPALLRLDGRKLEALFEPGNYVLAGKVAHLHAALTFRPKKAMILFNKLNAETMRREEESLPFKRDRLILWLDPYLAESDSTWLTAELDYWLEKGVSLVIVNNQAHFSMLRGKKVISIAGPWLYTFNQWALAYYIEQGVQAFIPPYEISRQDLYRLTEYLPAQFFAPIVFAYPDLFRIRADLSKKYGQANFIDRENNTFRLIGKRDYSVVVPERPFSITDLVPNLKKQGFRRFIVDLSNAEPSKGLYRDIARAVDQGSSLLNTTRFNWKEGFWSEETIRRDASKDDSKDASINKKPKSPPYAQRRQSRTR